MSLRLFIPYLALHSDKQDELVINPPATCSHCGSEPAAFYETHLVKLKAGRIPNRSIGRKYRDERNLLVRLPLCRACYLNDYLTTPDSYVHDDNPLGKDARRTATLSSIAGFAASIAILLITPFIPAVGILTVIKAYWYILLLAGLALLGIAWVLQRRSMREVRRELSTLRPGGSKYPRAMVWSMPVDGDFEPGSVILKIDLENERWANDCAHANTWRIE